MTEGYDRDHTERRHDDAASASSRAFVMGLLTGTVLGAGLGMLFAPRSGTHLRQRIADQAGQLADSVHDGYRRATDTASDWADKGRGVANRTRDAVARGADEARRYARDTVEATRRGESAGGATAQATASDAAFDGPASGPTARN